MRMLMGICISIVLALALLFQTMRASSQLAANRALRVAEESGLQMLTSDRVERSALLRNLELLRRAATDAPADPRIPMAIGSQYMILGNRSAAARWYRRALAVEARPEIYFNLGRALWLSGQEDESLEAYRAAVKLDPGRRGDVPEEIRSRI